MRLRVRVHVVSSRAQLRRVIVPALPLRETHLTNMLSWHCGALLGSRADLLRLGALVRLAAVSPHSAVFVPLRGSPVSESARFSAQDSGLADLVLVRREVPLRPADWPSIRARLQRGPHPGAPATMLAAAPRPPRTDEPWDWLRHELSVAEHAGTVFLSATARGLHETGDRITACGDDVAVNTDIHRFGGPVHLDGFRGPVWRTGRRRDDWEWNILGEDDRFRQDGWVHEPDSGWIRPAAARPRGARRVDRRHGRPHPRHRSHATRA
jgi:hypothetical protein